MPEAAGAPMSGLVGADPDRLRTVAQQFAAVAQETAAMETRLGRLLGLAAASDAYARVPALVSELREVTATSHRDALLLGDRALRQHRRSQPTAPPPTGAPVAKLKTTKYSLGPPATPPIPHHNHFPYDPKASPTAGDYLSRKKWMAYMWGAKATRADLEDGTAAYYHYWFGEGQPLAVNYEKAYQQDAVIRRWADNELRAARWAAERLYLRSGQTSFQMTGDRVDVRDNPATENWQKTLGMHFMWVTADVKVDGNRLTATATVNVRDWYNFNPGGKDIATGWPDDSNGRFSTIGWAKEFETHGSLQRVMTWTMGAADDAYVGSVSGSAAAPHKPVPSPAPTPLPSSTTPGGRR